MESNYDIGRGEKRKKVVDLPSPPQEKRQKPEHEQVVVDTGSFHASQKNLSSSGGIEEGSSRRAVERIHEEEVIQKEYVIDSTTAGGEESATKLGATEIPPEEGLTSGEEEEDEHEGRSDGAVQELSPESPKRSTRPQPGVDFNSSAMPGSMSTVRTEFSELYKIPEIEEMRLAAEAEAKIRSGVSTPGVGGHPLRSAWSFKALHAAVTVADTVLVAAIRNVSDSGQRTPAEAVTRSELEYAAQILTDEVIKFALLHVMTADEVERTGLHQHAVWPVRAIRAATILTDDILNTAIRRWNDEQAWRDEILERSWSQKAISVAHLVTKHILEAALHRVESATDVVPALQLSRQHDPLWSEDALHAAILLTDDILSSAVLHINASDGTGVHLSVQLPSEHPWTLDAIRAASKIVHSVLAEALEESFDAANPPLLAVSSTNEIHAAALHQLQQQGAVDRTNVDHKLHGVVEHHSQAFMPMYKPEDDILGFRRHSEETSVKTGSAHATNADTSVPSVSTTARSLSAEHPPEAVAQQPSGSARSGKVHHPVIADHQPSATSSTHRLSASKDAWSSRGPNDRTTGSPKDVGQAHATPMTDVNFSSEDVGSSRPSLSQMIPACPYGTMCKVKTRYHKEHFSHVSTLPSMGDVPTALATSTSSITADADPIQTGQISTSGADPVATTEDCFKKKIDRKILINDTLLKVGAPPVTFSHDVWKEAEALKDYIIPTTEILSRVDMRTACVFSVDKFGCVIKDNAFHWRRVHDDLHEVGIHINDASFFIRPGTQLDTAARARAETLYLGDQRVDFLPTYLCTDVLSLQPNVDRLCTSLILLLSQDYRLIEGRLEKTVIRSRAALTHQQAEKLLRMTVSDGESLVDDLSRSMKQLELIQRMMQGNNLVTGNMLAQQTPKGLLKFYREVTSEGEEDLIIENIDKDFDAKDLVGFYMELFNIFVTNYLYDTQPASALLRGQQRPSTEQLRPLMNAAHSHEFSKFEINISSFVELHRSVLEASVPTEPEFNIMLRMVAARCLKGNSAFFYCSGSTPVGEQFHYSSGCAQYSQCTSPARRYCDLYAQQRLSVAKGWIPSSTKYCSTEHVEDLAEHLNQTSVRTSKLVEKLKVVVHDGDFAALEASPLDHILSGITESSALKISSRTVAKRQPPESVCKAEFGNVLWLTDKKMDVFVPRYGRSFELKFGAKKDLFAYNAEKSCIIAGVEKFTFHRLLMIHLVVDVANPMTEPRDIHLIKPFIEGFSRDDCDGLDDAVMKPARLSAGAGKRPLPPQQSTASSVASGVLTGTTSSVASGLLMGTVLRAASGVSTSVHSDLIVSKQNKIRLECGVCSMKFKSTLLTATCTGCGMITCSMHMQPVSRHGCTSPGSAHVKNADKPHGQYEDKGKQKSRK